MSLIVISKELALRGISHPKGIVLDFNNSEACIDFFKIIDKEEISIYDITQNRDLDDKTYLSVNDHINCTGSNPLVGRQKKLGIDFVDMSTVYKQRDNGIITHSCGGKLNNKFKYPSHYLAHFIILARTFKFKRISAYLINNHM
jgi:hypothetical protein